MDASKVDRYVGEKWDDEIVPQLVEYIRIPNKSPMFDADWVQHGYMDDAVTIDRVLLNIGASKAEAIVAYRKANGPFRSPDQLALVKGVGLKTVEKNRDRIVVGGVAPATKPAAATPRMPVRR